MDTGTFQSLMQANQYVQVIQERQGRKIGCIEEAAFKMGYINKAQLLAIAEHVTKVHAICIDCGSIANHSFRLTKSKELVRLGEKDEYKPLCRQCFNTN